MKRSRQPERNPLRWQITLNSQAKHVSVMAVPAIERGIPHLVIETSGRSGVAQRTGGNRPDELQSERFPQLADTSKNTGIPVQKNGGDCEKSRGASGNRTFHHLRCRTDSGVAPGSRSRGREEGLRTRNTDKALQGYSGSCIYR